MKSIVKRIAASVVLTQLIVCDNTSLTPALSVQAMSLQQSQLLKLKTAIAAVQK
jgi:hypothetical protein